MAIACKKPFVRGAVAFGCGQCLPCRLTRRRIWANRIMLESLCHKDNCFLTLTYADENLSMMCGSSGNATLVPRDLQLWLKRFREMIRPLKMRFFAVGEYGDVNGRPHFHVCVFGVPGCSRGRTKKKFGTFGPCVPDDCCDFCRLVARSWPVGIIEVGELNSHSAQYIAQYTVKKMTAKDDIRLNGRHPEFARSSRQNGGIGHGALWDVASELMRSGYDELLTDVPDGVDFARKHALLGRYLRQKLRGMIGRVKDTPFEALQSWRDEMLAMQASSIDNETSFRQEVINQAKGRVDQIEAKARIFASRRKV